MAAPDKDTIYVDIDDEITTIIDKVHNSEGKIVALVLPKRATVFQSIVNMKLLKRAADVAKKHLVLVTTEANLMPLAGAVGLHVAPTPQSKPEIPTAAEKIDANDDSVVDEAEYTADTAGDLPIGELAKRSGHVIAGSDDEPVTLADEDEDTEDAGDEDKPARLKKNHSLKVPNFNRFRLGLFLSLVAVVLLIAGLYYALVVMPKAVIAITTNTSSVNVDLPMTFDSAAQSLDPTKLIVPAKAEQKQKTSTQQVNTTGQKNTGDTATGAVTMTAKSCNLFNPPQDIPAGTGVSTNGLTFITQNNVSFSPVPPYSNCEWQGSGSVAITAQSPGTKYNVSDADFTVAGRTDVTAHGSAGQTSLGQTPGTDNIINIVAQADIDNAKKKLDSQDTSAITASLEQALRTDGLYPLPETFKAGKAIVTTSSNVGDTADTVTVTEAVTYTMLGAKQSDLDQLVKAAVDKQIDTKNQSILDDGFANGKIIVTDNSGDKASVELQGTATVGPDINVNDIKSEAAGKKIGDIKELINAIPGVTNVDVRLSPFWVSAIPSDLHKITVTISKAS